MNLQQWIKRASRGLSPESQARVRAEIEEHYRSAMEEPFATEASAVEALGDPKAANRAYRRVLLTASEARRLHEAVRYERWRPVSIAVFALFLALPYSGLPTEAPFRPSYTIFCAGELLIAALAYFLPVLRGGKLVAYRVARWVWIGGFVSLMMADMLPSVFRFWLPITILGALAAASREWTHASLRRKLPPERWPKSLYL